MLIVNFVDQYNANIILPSSSLKWSICIPEWEVETLTLTKQLVHSNLFKRTSTWHLCSTKLRSETRTPETVHFVIALIHVHRSNMARKTNNMLSTDRWDVILTWLHSKGDAKESPFSGSSTFVCQAKRKCPFCSRQLMLRLTTRQ